MGQCFSYFVAPPWRFCVALIFAVAPLLPPVMWLKQKHSSLPVLTSYVCRRQNGSPNVFAACLHRLTYASTLFVDNTFEDHRAFGDFFGESDVPQLDDIDINLETGAWRRSWEALSGAKLRHLRIACGPETPFTYQGRSAMEKMVSLTLPRSAGLQQAIAKCVALEVLEMHGVPVDQRMSSALAALPRLHHLRIGGFFGHIEDVAIGDAATRDYANQLQPLANSSSLHNLVCCAS